MIMSYADMIFFISSSLIFIYYMSCSYFIAVSRASNTMLKSFGKRTCSCFILNLSRQASSVSPLNMILTIGYFCRHYLSNWKNSPVFIIYCDFFFNEWGLNFVNAFFGSISTIAWFFLFIWWCYHLH